MIKKNENITVVTFLRALKSNLPHEYTHVHSSSNTNQE